MSYMLTKSGQDVQVKSRMQEICTYGSVRGCGDIRLWSNNVALCTSKEQRNGENKPDLKNSSVGPTRPSIVPTQIISIPLKYNFILKNRAHQ